MEVQCTADCLKMTCEPRGTIRMLIRGRYLDWCLVEASTNLSSQSISTIVVGSQKRQMAEVSFPRIH